MSNQQTKSDEEIGCILDNVIQIGGTPADYAIAMYRLAESESQKEIERLKAELEQFKQVLEDERIFSGELKAELQSEKDKRVKMVEELGETPTMTIYQTQVEGLAGDILIIPSAHIQSIIQKYRE